MRLTSSTKQHHQSTSASVKPGSMQRACARDNQNHHHSEPASVNDSMVHHQHRSLLTAINRGLKVSDASSSHHISISCPTHQAARSMYSAPTAMRHDVYRSLSPRATRQHAPRICQYTSTGSVTEFDRCRHTTYAGRTQPNRPTTRLRFQVRTTCMPNTSSWCTYIQHCH